MRKWEHPPRDWRLTVAFVKRVKLTVRGVGTLHDLDVYFRDHGLCEGFDEWTIEKALKLDSTSKEEREARRQKKAQTLARRNEAIAIAHQLGMSWRLIAKVLGISTARLKQIRDRANAVGPRAESLARRERQREVGEFAHLLSGGFADGLLSEIAKGAPE